MFWKPNLTPKGLNLKMSGCGVEMVGRIADWTTACPQPAYFLRPLDHRLPSELRSSRLRDSAKIRWTYTFFFQSILRKTLNLVDCCQADPGAPRTELRLAM